MDVPARCGHHRLTFPAVPRRPFGHSISTAIKTPSHGNAVITQRQQHHHAGVTVTHPNGDIGDRAPMMEP
ncbi:MAG: hypothetical protein SYR96_33735 [Actinomycetota bacterium]|nr:hypothetical protein [Actinomycetota bacterium]